jgi:hypothetical protein
VAISFTAKPWFSPPDMTFEDLKSRRETKEKCIRGQDSYNKVLEEEKRYNFTSFTDRHEKALKGRKRR